MTLRYIHFVEQEFQIHFEDLELSKVDAYHLLHLAEMYSIVGEWTFSDFLPEHQFITRTVDGWTLNSARPTVEILVKHKKALDVT